MPGIRRGILALTIAGCGETPEEGTKPFKDSNSPPIQELLKATSENMKNNSINKGPEEKKPAGKTEKDGAKKPSAESKPDQKK